MPISKTISSSYQLGTKCLVCEHPDGSAHFGSTSCLACAAFFRRTVSLNITFECKKENKCIIYHELRMICRACRFDKCLNAGMNRDCVQKKRTNKKSKLRNSRSSNNEDSQEYFDYSGEQTDNTSPISIDKKVSCASIEDEKFINENEKYLGQLPSTSSASTTPFRAPSPMSTIFININTRSIDVLRFHVDQLRSSMCRRKIMFANNPLGALLNESSKLPFETYNPPPHSLKRQIHSQRFDNLLASDFCRSCPGFDLLDPMEKAIFYRSCSLAYCLLDIAWLTVCAYKEEHPNPLMMFTDGSICTLNDMSYGWDDEEDIDSNEKQKIFINFLKRFNEAVCRPIRIQKVDEVEFSVLKGLCMWKLGYMEFTRNMKLIASEHERALLSGLNEYYLDLCYDQIEIAQRIGNIILMMGTIFEMNHLIIEMFKSAEIFGLFKIDDISKQLLSI